MNNVFDLFCGAGGFSKGLEKAGFNIVGGVDKDKKSIETWNKNHDGQGFNIDLTDTSPEKIENKIDEDINIIIGGPPCQDFTKCNRTINLGRNNLILLFAEYVKQIEPDFFMMENVRQLETRYDDILETFISNLSQYNISHRVLNTVDYGVPQHRLRTIVIGYKNNFSIKPLFPQPTHGPQSNLDNDIVSSREVLKNVCNPFDLEFYECTGDYGDLLEDIPEGMNYSFYTDKYNHPEPKFEWRSKFSDFLYKADPEKPIRSLKAKPGGGTGPFHWDNRRFTEEELKLLQGFPKKFKLPNSYTQCVKQIGNSVPPIFAEKLGFGIRKQLPVLENLEENPINNLITEDKNLDIISRKRTNSEIYKKKARQKLQELEMKN